MATTPSSGQPVGTIKVVIGDVKIVGVDGVVRVAHVGDKVFAKEVLITAANAVVQVQLENGNLLDMGRSSELALDGEILDAAVAGGGAAQPPVQTAAQAQQDVAALQAAIAAGVDPTKIAEATAAGAPGAGGVGGANDSGSHEPVVVQQGSPTQAVTAGFDTQGPPAPAFPTLQTQLLPPEQTTPNAPPAVTAQLAAGNVFEAGLPGGSSPGAPALTVTGTFQLSDPEGLSTITNLQINNVSIPIANLVGSTVAGTAGTLVVTGYNAATGAGTFQYTLKVAVTDVANAPELETFSFAVSDDSGATFSLPASVSINIVDDLPLARPDTNAIAEDAVSVSGNVLTNDSSFADAPASFVAWGAQAAQFGTITQNADGSYVYALNNALAAVQGLSVGQSLTETFGYTMRDADGDTSSSTLTITINGTNDGVTISGGIGAAGGDQTVFENDLAAGSSPDAAALTKSGTFTIDAKDGIATVEVGGATLTAAQLQALGTTPLTIDTLGGVLVLNGYTGTVAGGTVNYSYTLQDPVAHAAGAGANSASESFAVKVTDKDGSTATSTLSITIVDDLPSISATAAAADSLQVDETVLATNATTSFAGLFTSAFGADAAGSLAYGLSVSAAGVDSGIDDVATGQNVMLSMNGAVVEGRTQGSNDLVFTLTVNSAAGTVTLDQIRAVVHPNTGNANDEVSVIDGVVRLTATITDKDGDSQSATINLGNAISFLDDGPSISANLAVQLDDDALAGGNAGGTGDVNPDTANTSGTLAHTYGADGGSIAYLTTGAPAGFSYVAAGNDLLVKQGATTVMTLTLNTTTGAYTVTQNAAILHAAGNQENDQGFTINYRVTDRDGDSVDGTLAINVDDDTPTAQPQAEQTLREGTTVQDALVFSGGADGATVTSVGGTAIAPVGTTTVVGAFGSLVIDPQGATKFTYTANNAVVGTQFDRFDFTITDKDGDPVTVPGGLVFKIVDANVPIVDDTTVTLDEEGLAGGLAGNGTGATGDVAGEAITVSGTLTRFDYGKDGQGSIALSGGPMGVFALDGTQVQATWNAGTSTLTGMAGAVKMFDIVVNQTNGNFSATIYQPFKHSVSGVEDDVSLTTTVTVTDGDGSVDTGNFTLTIDDDTPTVAANINNVNEGALLTVTAAGGVLANDVAGADGFAAGGGVVGVRAAGGDTTTAVTTGVGGGIAGLHGTLTLAADGSYTYQSTANNISANTTDVFVYTMKDGDGDLSTTTLTINLTDSGLAAPADNDVLVNENALDLAKDGADLVAGTVTGSLPGSTAETDGANQLNATGGFGGLTYAVEGSATGTYGTIQINANGTYVYTLSKPYDTSPDANDGTNTEDNRDSFTYRVTDANGNTTTGSITVDIVDDVPTARADVDSVKEDAFVGEGRGPIVADGNVITGAGGADANATDGQADTAGADGIGSIAWAGAVAGVVAGAHGSLAVGTNGSYAYTLTNTDPAVQALGDGGILTEIFTYTITDNDGDTSQATLTVTINGTNDAPVAVADTNAGDAVIEAGVNPGNTAFAGDTTAVGNVLTNDTDVDTGDTKTVSAVNGVAGNVGAVVGGTYGSVTIGANGAYTYTLDNADPDTNALAQGASVTDQFTYTMRDASGATSSSTLTITITGTNDAPVAVADTGTASEAGVNPGNTAFAGVTTATGNVLTNDTDVDTGDTKAVSAVAGVAGNVGVAVTGTYGSVTIGANGAYTYTLDNADPDTNALAQGASVTDQFTYTMRDANGATSSSTLTITITGTNDAPVAVADTGTASEAGVNPGNTAFAGVTTATGNVLTNDTDVDTGDTKAVSAVAGVAGNVGAVVVGTYGSVTIGATGAYTYTLDNADPDTNALAQGASVTDQFTYTMVDANGATSSSTLTITITGTNDAPVAVADTGAVSEAGVNPGNTAFAGVTTATGNVLTNDTDVDTGDTKAVSAVAGVAGNVGVAVVGTYGSVTIGANGAYTYTLDNADPDTNALAQGASVTDQFTYTMRDANGATSSSTLTITITGTNDAPVAVADTGTASEAGVNPGNTAFAGVTTATGNVLTNDTDVDTGDTKAVSAVNGVAGNVGAAVTGTYGSVTIGATGAYTYTLDNADPDTNALAQGASVTDQFTYTMRDANGATSSSTLTITITGTNDAPVAVADTGAVSEAGVNPGNTPFAGVTTATGNVLTNDTDVDTGDTKTVSAVAGVAGNVGVAVVGTYGSVTIGATGAYTYTLDNADPDTNALAQGASVTDQFTYTMVDANGATSSSTLTVTITGTNDLPVVVNTQNWVPSDPAQQTPNYTAGYPLWLTLATDVDTGTALVVKATGTIPTGVFYDPGTGYVALTAGTTLYDAGAAINLLDKVIYKPTTTVNDTVGTSLSLSVFDGLATVTQTVGIHEVGPNRLPSQTAQIGDGSSPLTSGNDQTQVISLSQSLVDGLSDPSAGHVVVYTDFQQNPIVLPVPSGERNPGVFGDASAGSHREQEVQVEIRIGTNKFAVIEDDMTAGTFEQSWFFDATTGFMKADVANTNIFLLDGAGNATATTLAGYLSANPPSVGDQWTLVYADNAGGNFQARSVKFEFFANDPGDPGIVVNPDSTAFSGQNDQIYGTSGRDVLTGGAGDDRIEGRAGGDTLAGNAGNDILNGGDGDDILTGGIGTDTMTGGIGSDTFKYTTLADGIDTIVDFDIAAPGAGGDVLDISAVLDLPGNTWVDGSGVAAADAGGYISFTNNGGKVQVNVDIDGTAGGGAPVAVAVLQNVPFVSAADALTKLTDNIKVD